MGRRDWSEKRSINDGRSLHRFHADDEPVFGCIGFLGEG